MALRGTLFVYQGEELGLEEVPIPEHLRQDPFFFRTKGAHPGRDGCRTPMPWTPEAPGHGFTDGESTWLPFGLDATTRNLTSPAGVVVALSGTEFRLLRILLAHPNRVLTRDQLIDLMLSRDATPFDRSIDVHISRLRRKVESDPQNPALIKTIRHEGYFFTPPVVLDDAAGTAQS